MLGEAIKKRLDKRPFEPFRLHITGGDAVEIRHPELAFLTRYAPAPLRPPDTAKHGRLSQRLVHELGAGRHRSGRNGDGRSRRSRGK